MGGPDLKAQLQSAVDDVFASADAADRAIATVKRRRRVTAAALASAGAAGAVLAGVLLLNGGSNSGDAPATVIPVSPTPASPSRPASCPAPVLCGGALLTPFPSVQATPTTAPNPHPQGTISDAGPQISATRWMNVNSWTSRSADGSALSVYAGGATIDPTLEHSNATFAAVLVITPEDYYRFEHGQVALSNIGTIYSPSPHQQGKLQVISADGNLLTLNLVGTSQDYVFDAGTDTFQ